MDVRWHAEIFKNCFQSVVRNSLVNGEWGNEEREGKNPFERLTAFDLEIRNEEFAFQVCIPLAAIIIEYIRSFKQKLGRLVLIIIMKKLYH